MSVTVQMMMAQKGQRTELTSIFGVRYIGTVYGLSQTKLFLHDAVRFEGSYLEEKSIAVPKLSIKIEHIREIKPYFEQDLIIRGDSQEKKVTYLPSIITAASSGRASQYTRQTMDEGSIVSSALSYGNQWCKKDFTPFQENKKEVKENANNNYNNSSNLIIGQNQGQKRRRQSNLSRHHFAERKNDFTKAGNTQQAVAAIFNIDLFIQQICENDNQNYNFLVNDQKITYSRNHRSTTPKSRQQQQRRRRLSPQERSELRLQRNIESLLQQYNN